MINLKKMWIRDSETNEPTEVEIEFCSELGVGRYNGEILTHRVNLYYSREGMIKNEMINIKDNISELYQQIFDLQTKYDDLEKELLRDT